MTSISKRNPISGFTLIELLVTLSILMVLMMMSAPPLMKYIQRSKIMSAVQQTTSLMRLARIQAIKRGTPVVVEIQPTIKPPAVRAFVDTDRDHVLDTDEQVLGTILLEKGVTFLYGYGFTTATPSSLPPVAVFLETGSIEPPSTADPKSGYQFTDIKGNELEVYVKSPITARIEIRKHEGAAWVTAGEGGTAWTWK